MSPAYDYPPDYEPDEGLGELIGKTHWQVRCAFANEPDHSEEMELTWIGEWSSTNAGAELVAEGMGWEFVDPDGWLCPACAMGTRQCAI